MNAVWNSYGQLCGCPEIFKKSCKFFCRELDIRVEDEVQYLDAKGNEIRKVRIGGIEYGREGLRETAALNPGGTYGSHYGILIKGHSKEEFEIDGSLRA